MKSAVNYRVIGNIPKIIIACTNEFQIIKLGVIFDLQEIFFSVNFYALQSNLDYQNYIGISFHNPGL